jgi:hypothetical protein
MLDPYPDPEQSQSGSTTLAIYNFTKKMAYLATDILYCRTFSENSVSEGEGGLQ